MQIITKQRFATEGRTKQTRTRSRGTKGLSAKKVGGYMRFVLFLAAIGVAYIWNSHLADRQVRRQEFLDTQVKDLKSNYLMRQSVLLSGTRFTEVEKSADTLGLNAMDKPAYQLMVNLPEPVPFVRNMKRRYLEIRPDTTAVEQTDTLPSGTDPTLPDTNQATSHTGQR